MFDTYFANDGSADAVEFNRSLSLIEGMVDHMSGIDQPSPGSVVANLDAMGSPSPISPSAILRRYSDHSLFNLKHIADTIVPRRTVSVPVIMTALRVSLLASSRLCYVVASPDMTVAKERMATIYALESKSASRYTRTFSEKSSLPGMHPPANSLLAQFSSTAPQPGHVTETHLLQVLKSETLTEMVTRTGHDVGVVDVLTDHLFHTTSGAAHGYMWIELDGVVAHFVAQLGWTTTIANVVFNKYIEALAAA